MLTNFFHLRILVNKFLAFPNVRICQLSTNSGLFVKLLAIDIHLAHFLLPTQFRVTKYLSFAMTSEVEVTSN